MAFHVDLQPSPASPSTARRPASVVAVAALIRSLLVSRGRMIVGHRAALVRLEDIRTFPLPASPLRHLTLAIPSLKRKNSPIISVSAYGHRQVQG